MTKHSAFILSAIAIFSFTATAEKFELKKIVQNAESTDEAFPKVIEIQDQQFSMKLPMQAKEKTYKLKKGDCVQSESIQTYTDPKEGKYSLKEKSKICEKDHAIDVSLEWLSHPKKQNGWAPLATGTYHIAVAQSGDLTFERTNTETATKKTEMFKAEYSKAK